MSVSRVVALLTPVFAALSGYLATQALRLPGAPVLDQGEVTAVFAIGAGAGLTAAVKWLHGRSGHERQQLALEAEDRREAAWAERPEPEGDDMPEPEPERVLRLDIETIEAIRAVSGVRAAASDASRALQSVRGLDARLEALEAQSGR